jgi:pilus assembly protein Flp/PilA
LLSWERVETPRTVQGAAWTVREEEGMLTIERFIQDESGQDLIEYALLASLIAIVSVASLKLLGTKVAGFYETVGSKF